MIFKMLFLKKQTLSELRMSWFRLFHSVIVEGKEEFFKKLCFVQTWGIFSEFLVKYPVFDKETYWER